MQDNQAQIENSEVLQGWKRSRGEKKSCWCGSIMEAEDTHSEATVSANAREHMLRRMFSEKHDEINSFDLNE